MEVLTVTIPLEPLVYRLFFTTLGKTLTYPKSALRGMRFSLLLAQPTDPPGTPIVGSMSPQYPVSPYFAAAEPPKYAKARRSP